LASCGLAALDKLTSLVAPKDIDALKFSELEAALEMHLKPSRRLTIAERTRFFALRQSGDESIADFLVRIRKSVRHCKFDSLKQSSSPEEEMVCLTLIVGMRDAGMQQRVLEKMQDSTVSAAAIVDVVRNAEQVKAFVAAASTGDSFRPQSIGAGDSVHFAKNSRTRQARQIRDCKFCGQSHLSGKCPAYGKICTKCSKRNHFARVCQSSAASAHHVADDSAEFVTHDGDDADVLHLSDVDLVHSIEAASEMILIEGRAVPMQVDTGASVSVISSAVWESLQRPQLLKCHRRLEAYDGHTLRTLGKLATTVEMRGRLFPSELTVIASSKPFGLLGRDLLDAEAVFFSAESVCPLVEPLPTIKGVKARMELHDGAKPQFCRARPVPIALEKQINAELTRLQQLGVIEPLEGPVSNASPVVRVKKRDGPHRR
jgi:hypothetical protein